jgi:hypothetical protein
MAAQGRYPVTPPVVCSTGLLDCRHTCIDVCCALAARLRPLSRVTYCGLQGA